MRVMPQGWQARIAALAVALLGAAPRAAEACSACTVGRDDETRFAFLATTVFLSVLPLAMVGGLLWWLRRRARALEARRAEGAAATAASRL